jgi:hypothetical protein
MVVPAVVRCRNPNASKEQSFAPPIVADNAGVLALGALTASQTFEPEVSSLLVPVGTLSPDESVCVGRDGYLFLYKGGNDLRLQHDYDPNGELVRNATKRWVDLIAERLETTKIAGTLLYQIIIPEKSTVLPHLAPPGLGPITPLFNVLNEALRCSIEGAGDADIYHNLIDPLRGLIKFGHTPFPRTDSHMTTIGTATVLSHVLRFLRSSHLLSAGRIDSVMEKIDGATARSRMEVFNGDISGRLFSRPVFEMLQACDLSDIHRWGTDLTTRIVAAPDNAAHVGTNIIWSNKSAPIDLKVVAFANSFFERGAAPRGLSWWFKHLFREFHFVWSPDMQRDYITGANFDLVVCQTIERFVYRVPRS